MHPDRPVPFIPVRAPLLRYVLGFACPGGPVAPAAALLRGRAFRGGRHHRQCRASLAAEAAALARQRRAQPAAASKTYRTRALSVTLAVRAGVPLGHMGRDGVDLGAHAPLGFSHWVACLSRLLRRRRGAVPRGAGVRLRDGRHATGRRRVLDLALKRRARGRLRGSVWIHAVSVGETLAAAPLIEAFAQSVSVHMVEVSPALREMQRKSLRCGETFNRRARGDAREAEAERNRFASLRVPKNPLNVVESDGVRGAIDEIEAPSSGAHGSTPEELGLEPVDEGVSEFGGVPVALARCGISASWTPEPAYPSTPCTPPGARRRARTDRAAWGRWATRARCGTCR